MVASINPEYASLLTIIRLFHRSYAVPAISCLYDDEGAKFVTLVNRLGASRDTVSRTLAFLMEQGIVVKNPGYGHPMRPEYILTGPGERLGAVCAATTNVIDDLGIRRVAFRKWSMPAVLAIGQGAERFSSLLARLDGVTPRALTGALRDLDQIDVITREVTEGWPPHPRYTLAPAGELLMPTLDELRAVTDNA